MQLETRKPNFVRDFPHETMIWKGKKHLGDEPGVYDDAKFTGLTLHLPFSLQRTKEMSAADHIQIGLDVEDVNTPEFSNGHKVSLYLHQPFDGEDVEGAWVADLLSVGYLRGRAEEIVLTADLSEVPGLQLYLSVCVTIDMAVMPGCYNDFLVTRLFKRSQDHRYIPTFGFTPLLRR